MTTSPRIAYADLDAAPLVAAIDAMTGDVAADAAARLARELFALRSPRALALADLVLGSTGPFARLCAAGAGREDARLAIAAAELGGIGQMAQADLAGLLAQSGGVGAGAASSKGLGRPRRATAGGAVGGVETGWAVMWVSPCCGLGGQVAKYADSAAVIRCPREEARSCSTRRSKVSKSTSRSP